MSCFPSLESRPLKRSRIGAPDVYPQDVDQKEDIMSEDYVRSGFPSSKAVREEHESAREIGMQMSTSDLWEYFDTTMSKKRECCTLPEIVRKKQNFRDNYMHPIEKNKEQMNNWFKDLSGSTALSKLGRRLPYYIKKEDMLCELLKNDVPVTRAIWFIKMSSMQATVMAEAAKNRKTKTDPSIDWTSSICHMLKDIFIKLYSEIAADTEFASSHREWDYLFTLLLAMYDSDLVEHWEVLIWIISMLEKLTAGELTDKPMDIDNALKFILPYVLEVGVRFAESEILTRRILFWACNTFADIINDDPQVQSYYMEDRVAFQSLMDSYLELNSCTLHRTIVLSLSGIIMALTFACPAATVWNEVKVEDSYLQGSPLDVLPCSLATLPAPPGPESAGIREQLKRAEEAIVERSVMAESQWYTKANSHMDDSVNHLLHVLDAIDLHDYNMVRENNTMDLLFVRVFGTKRSVHSDGQLVLFLCEWVVSVTRSGIHRPIVVACLLEQLKLSSPSKEFIQETLMTFLDTKAPFLDGNVTVDSEPFRNLVCLFGELIDRQIFCHDTYVRTFIARGVFETGAQPLAPPSFNAQQFSVHSEVSDDNDKVSMDNPDSVRSEASGLAAASAVPGTGNAQSSLESRQHNRHIHYLIQFPLVQDDTYLHEQNQRAQLLYGVGRAREQARLAIKRLVRDICKLFTKKIYLLDVVQGEMGKRKNRGQRDEDSLHEEITRRFKALSYHDMECVVSRCISVFMDTLRGNIKFVAAGSGAGAGNGSGHPVLHLYLPVPRTVSTFFELIEMSLNITCLLQTVTDTVSKLQRLLDTYFKTRIRCMNSYMSFLCLHAVGILRKYQSVLMNMEDLKKKAFNQLILLVRQVGDPTQCSSFERCILAYLHDLFQSSQVVQNCFSQIYGKASSKVSSALFRQLEPSDGTGTFNSTYADDLIQNASNGNSADSRTYIDEIQSNVDARYSFVCKILIFICKNQAPERISYACILSAEMTAMCSNLPSEWLGALYCLLSARTGHSGYVDLAGHVDLSDTQMYDGLATLIGTLLARHCFTMADFVQHIICPAMAQGLDQSTAPVEPHLEPTIRLACHILHRLFTVEYAECSGRIMCLSGPSFKLSEPLLLTGALQKISTEFLVDILKMLIVHSDKANEEDRVGPKRDFIESLYASVAASSAEERPAVVDIRSIKLGEFAHRVLREICNVPWVRERFSKETSSRLIRENVLIDKNFTHQQARNLLSIIYRPTECLPLAPSTDISTVMTGLMRNLNLWTLRFSNMELQLLLTQISAAAQQNEVLDKVARHIVDLFQAQAESWLSTSSEPGIPEVHLREDDSSWLLPPLIAMLPEPLKSQIVKAASEKLKSGKNFWTQRNDQEKEKELRHSSVVLANPPFLIMLLDCLKTNDQQDELLNSLHDQIDYFVQNARETEDKVPDDLRVRQILQECLQVRLGLVGRLFPRIQDDHDVTGAWGVLLAQLIAYGVVEVHSNQTLFYTVLDMLATLVHTLIAKNAAGVEWKAYQSVAKKIRREIAEKLVDGVDLIKPLLPFVKNTYDVVAVVPVKASGRGGHSKSDLGKTRKHGYVLQKKERINPWEVIEGMKNLFSLSWFGAISTEISMSRIEEQGNLLLSHDHPVKLRKPDAYFFEPPTLHPEDLEPDPREEARATNTNTPQNMASNSSGPGNGPLCTSGSMLLGSQSNGANMVASSGASFDRKDGILGSDSRPDPPSRSNSSTSGKRKRTSRRGGASGGGAGGGSSSGGGGAGPSGRMTNTPAIMSTGLMQPQGAPMGPGAGGGGFAGQQQSQPQQHDIFRDLMAPTPSQVQQPPNPSNTGWMQQGPPQPTNYMQQPHVMGQNLRPIGGGNLPRGGALAAAIRVRQPSQSAGNMQSLPVHSGAGGGGAPPGMLHGTHQIRHQLNNHLRSHQQQRHPHVPTSDHMYQQSSAGPGPSGGGGGLPNPPPYPGGNLGLAGSGAGLIEDSMMASYLGHGPGGGGGAPPPPTYHYQGQQDGMMGGGGGGGGGYPAQQGQAQFMLQRTGSGPQQQQQSGPGGTGAAGGALPPGYSTHYYLGDC